MLVAPAVEQHFVNDLAYLVNPYSLIFRLVMDLGDTHMLSSQSSDSSGGGSVTLLTRAKLALLMS